MMKSTITTGRIEHQVQRRTRLIHTFNGSILYRLQSLYTIHVVQIIAVVAQVILSSDPLYATKSL